MTQDFTTRINGSHPLIKLKDSTIAWDAVKCVSYLPSAKNPERVCVSMVDHNPVDCTGVVTPALAKEHGFNMEVSFSGQTLHINPFGINQLTPSEDPTATTLHFRQGGKIHITASLEALTRKWEAALNERASGRSGAPSSQSPG